MSMTNEQREAIEKLEYVNRWYDCNNYYSRYELNCIDTVLSLIKEQQQEIEGLKNKEVLIKRYFKKCDLIKQKDKQIDLMAEFIEKVTVDLKVAFGENMLWNRNEIKQYFADLVEKE